MTGGAGFSKLGESLQRTNRSFLKHTESFKNFKDEYAISKKRTRYRFKTPTKKGLQAIRERALSDGKKERKKMMLIGGILLIIGVILIITFMS